MRGLLVAIEGINGSGKSTIIKGLQAHFRDLDQEVRVYKFPDRHGHQGRRIDQFLRNQNAFEYKYDMLDAFAANKRAVLDQILSDLYRGAIVICDRYLASGIAYHIPSGASAQSISAYCEVLGHFDREMPTPDITYLIAGDYLHLRQEYKQRFHHDRAKALKLFDLFKKIVPRCSERHVVVCNELGRLSETIAFMVNDILRYC